MSAPQLLCTQPTALQMFPLLQRRYASDLRYKLSKQSPFTKCMGIPFLGGGGGSWYSRGQQKTTGPDWGTVVVQQISACIHMVHQIRLNAQRSKMSKVFIHFLMVKNDFYLLLKR